MKRLAVKGNNVKQYVQLRGDPRSPEPELFEIEFPFGVVYVQRASSTSPDYWVHITMHAEDDGDVLSNPDWKRGGALKRMRVDHDDKGAFETAIKLTEDPAACHFAVRVGPSTDNEGKSPQETR